MEPILRGEIDLEGALKDLLPKQKEYLSAPERYVSYTGGFGSGKTLIGCAGMILLGREIPNSLWLIGRLHQPALEATTRRTFQELFPREWLAKNGNKIAERGGGRILMNNGSEFLFRHLNLDNDQYKSHINSLNLSGFYVDQAEEIPKEVFFLLTGRLRRKTTPSFHCGRVTANAAGHDWNWATFHNPNRPERLKKLTRGITAPSTENYHNAPDYVEGMAAVLPDDWQQRYIYGSFADFSDLIYKDFSTTVHVYDGEVQRAIFGGSATPPLDWPVIIGLDIGGVDEWAWVYLARAPEGPLSGTLFQFAEIYESGILIKELADRHHEIMEGRNLDGIAYDYENQQAAYELSEGHGIAGSPANKDVKPGIFKMAQYIHPDLRLINPFTGVSGSPRYFISSKCENTIRELSVYRWAKDRFGNATGEPEDKNNHCTDAVRYAIHTFRPEPMALPKPQKWEAEGLDENSRLYWYLTHKHDERMKQHRFRRHFGYVTNFPRTGW